jgi:predicted nucleotidyltransferase
MQDELKAVVGRDVDLVEKKDFLTRRREDAKV